LDHLELAVDRCHADLELQDPKAGGQGPLERLGPQIGNGTKRGVDGDR
jgi:hypothetical protein